MPYEVCVHEHLHAAHAIPTPSGQLEPTHWHRWGIEVVFAGSKLERNGVLVDFELVRDRMRVVLQPLEGTNLNEQASLAGGPTSAEGLARHVYESLAAEPWGAAQLARVIVHEAPGCRAAYLAAPASASGDT